MISDYGESPERATVRIQRLLPGPIERVWEFLTDSEKRSLWFAGGAMELRAGGRGVLTFHPGALSPSGEPMTERYKKYADRKMGTTVLRVEPPRLLTFTFGDEADASEVTFELTPRGDDVLLVLTHRRLRDRGMMLGVSGGWHLHLDTLVDRLNGVPPRPFWSRMETLEAEYDKRLPRD
jgi:uncharacterized protein YndB with AHSA1/START domain